MRAKRSKKYRKIMSAYQMSFSFREPYQVLLDSHFLQTCHSFHMPLQKYLENTLHGECRLFVTKCSLAKIMADWEKKKSKGAGDKGGDGKTTTVKRGPWRPEFLPRPTEVPLRHCKHKNDEGEDVGEVGEARCLLDLLAGQPHGNEQAKNKQHYVLATADAEERERNSRGFVDVRERARSIPGVPIVYVKRSVMILEELSGVSESVRRKGEKDKFSHGLLGLGDRKRKRADGDSDDDDDELSAGRGEAGGPKLRGAKKVKGANPLSIMKKKLKGPSTQGEHSGAEVAVSSHSSQAKRRKRKHGGRKADDAGKDGEAEKDVPAGAVEAVA